MTLPQFFLMRLVADGGLTIGEASQQVGVTPAAITLLATRLVRAGLLTRQRDSQDRRIVRLRLTPVGQQRLAELEGKRLAIVRRYLTSIRPTDLDLLVTIVQQLADGTDVPDGMTEPDVTA
jgi:DNA-binding MarR family transcriptional regulator